MQAYWLEQTTADVPATNGWLSNCELLCLNAVRFLKRRTEWRLGRWAAKRAVSSYLGLSSRISELASIEVRSAPSGAPEIFVDNHPAALTISLSHRAGRALCVVMPPAVKLGCDLELVEPRSTAFFSDYFTDEEQTLIARAPATEQAPLSTLLWSGKESALKALQTGLRLPTASVVVRLSAGRFDFARWNQLEVHHIEGQLFYGWWQQDDGFIRSLVADLQADCPVELDVTDKGDTARFCA